MTLIKWPGGKNREITHIADRIPSFTRYIEPFFGGGAVFFHIQPKAAAINDLSSDLMTFYHFVKNQDSEFKKYLYLYNQSWSDLKEAAWQHTHILVEQLASHRIDGDKDSLAKACKHLVQTVIAAASPSLPKEIIECQKTLSKEIHHSCLDKVRRTLNLEKKLGRSLPKEEAQENIVSGILAGLYMHYRSLYNTYRLRDKAVNPSTPLKAANFYFVREFCYGSMFRFNAKGAFNIPYGGISYNKKQFDTKIAKIFTADTAERFENTALYCTDFEAFFHEIKPTEDDFIFLDPPYDSVFSSYDGKSFTEEDHIRLAKVLAKTAASYLLVIKKTTFIEALYQQLPGVHFAEFEKKYAYNVRRRNNRETKHIIIANYPL